MTLTTALIANIVLMAGIVTALAAVVRIPFTLPRPRVLANATFVAGVEDELSKAA